MRKTLPKTHKTISSFPLHSTHSYQIFFKNHPKLIQKLDLDSATITSLKPDQVKKVLQNLMRLTKKSRNIRSFQDINLLKSFKAKKSQAILLIKKFHRVQSLSLLWDFYDIQIQKETRRWLKYIKRLQCLVFRHVDYRTRPRPSMIAPSKRLNQKLIRDIKQRRIRNLVHSPSPGFPFIPAFKYNKGNYYSLDMRDYPSSVQEISLNLAKSVIALDDHFEKLILMRKFSGLTRLELLFCLELSMALMLLESIPNPQILASLGLYLRNRFPEYDERAIIRIFEFIRNNCSGLDKLDLRITHPTEKLGVLNFQNKLRILNLWVSVKAERHLKDLGIVVSTAKNLESLGLLIDFDVSSVLSKEDLDDFYKRIGELSHLKKLSLNLSPAENHFTRKDFLEYIHYKMPPSSYTALLESIACLNRLEELSLRIPDDLQVHLLGEALGGVAQQLKKLEVDFYEQALDIEGNFRFLHGFRNMKELQELCIYRFSFTQEKNLSDFKESLKNFKSLDKMTLHDFKIPPEGDEILGDLVLSVLSKKGLKELRIKHLYQDNVRKGRTTLAFDEILKKNPQLRIAKIESQNIAFQHSSYFHPFESFKYT